MLVLLIIILAMVVVGLIIGWLGGIIWKGNRPYGARADYLASVITAVVVGLMDWYFIPLLNFSDGIKYIGIAIEPALSALVILWVMRKVKR
jgi:uncharacterized membrane protein YeaQ/YmgE (transglycosylase-associated protein family)